MNNFWSPVSATVTILLPTVINYTYTALIKVSVLSILCFFFVFSNQVLLQPRSISQPEDTLHLHLHSSIMNHFLPLFHSAIFLRKTLKCSASDKSLLKSSARKFIDLRVKLNLEHLPVICVTKLHNPRWAFRVVQDTERERAQVRQKHH